MTTTQDSTHLELPRTVGIKHPRRGMLHRLRPTFASVIHRRWDLEMRGLENFPTEGPVVVASNHIGFLDGPLMAIVGPRPVHALTKRELFVGPLGTFLHGSGQIPISRDVPDPRALRTALRVLRDGGVAGVFPESTRGSGDMAKAAGGAAYLALVTGAPVVPMSVLGTRLPGSRSSFPPRGTRFALSYGPALTVDAQPWPRRTADIQALTERIRLAIIATADEASQATGMTLPGPLPEADKDEQ
ncbi:1-acyl-sn-glycerol-3-phosphate acyltransferase [Marmoricola sp. OAE513]|uniref:lysophospholipid acyltransferase family protein n=1 Tax=Marmoricola sp. OAE513 TaxID=2817894 RepID=UPI001AE91073